MFKFLISLKTNFTEWTVRNISLLFILFQVVPYIFIYFFVTGEFEISFQSKVIFFIFLFAVHVAVLFFCYVSNKLAKHFSFSSAESTVFFAIFGYLWVICFTFILILSERWVFLFFYIPFMVFKLLLYPRNPTILKEIPFLYSLQLKIINIYDTTISDQKIIKGHFEKELKEVSYFRNMQLVYLLLVFLSLLFTQPYDIPSGMIVTSFCYFWYGLCHFYLFMLKFPCCIYSKSCWWGCGSCCLWSVFITPVIPIEVNSPFGHLIQQEMLGV